MATKIPLGSTSLIARSSYTGSFASVYGIGLTKAKRLTAFLLAHPTQKFVFQDQFVTMFAKLPIDRKIRVSLSQRLRKQFTTDCYKSYRVFQHLPANGQRTKANGNTPSRLTHYLQLGINPELFSVYSIHYKRKELANNGRFDELKAYNKLQLEKAEQSKTDRQLQNKKSREKVIKQRRLGN
jgi:ribosomal protein S13